MLSPFEGCTESQREAINHIQGPLLIVAGPGAGKTEVLVRRTSNLVLNAGVQPRKILVTTFTHKATDELYDRLWQYLGPQAQDITISTVHSFCRTLLAEHSESHPWGRSFDVLDGMDQHLFVYARLKDLGLGLFPKGRPGEFLADVVGFFSLCTEELVDPAKLAEMAKRDGVKLLGLKSESDEGAEEYIALAQAYGQYLELLRHEKLLDFAMLQKVCHEMLVDEKVRAQVAEQYRYLLVDEYQDTNRLQVRIFQQIAAPANNLCVVGDDDQSIYRFRGATPSNFLQFEKDFPGAKRVDLTTNFRSTPQLVVATSSLIAMNAPHRREKNLRSGRDSQEHPPILVRARTCREEAEKAVGFLMQAKEQGLIKNYGEAALLFRSVKYHAQDYLDVLAERQLPFVVGGDGGFFDREDIVQLRDLIKFSGWKKDWDPRCLEGKLLLLTPETIEALKKCTTTKPDEWNEDRTLTEIGVKDPQDRAALRTLSGVRLRFQNGEIKSLLDLFYELLGSTGYFTRCCESCQREREGQGALLNLSQFSRLVGSFQRLVRTQNSYRFGEYLRNLPDRALDEIRPAAPDDAIRVMTVHQAKGLEYPLVVVGSALNGRFPGRFHPPKYPLPPGLRLSGEKDEAEEDLRDQRRLFYVAATRAESVLVVGAPDKVAKRGGGVSPFVAEMGEKRFVDEAYLTVRPPEVKRCEKKHAPRSQRISFSAIQSYLICPFQYRLLGECEFEVPQAHWFQLGRILHSALEILHRRARRGEPITAEQALDEAWRAYPYWSRERADTMKKTALRYLVYYCQGHAERFSRIHWVEEPVEYRASEEFVVVGQIDLACRLPGSLELVEFKARTKKRRQQFRPDLQAYTYALACESGKGEHVGRIVIHYLAEKPENDIEDLPWGARERDEADGRLHVALDGIKSGRFDPTPGDHCVLCDFQDLCPASQVRGSPARREDDEPRMGATFRTRIRE